MVPMKLLVRASSFMPCLAKPKSVTLMWPSLSRSTFSWRAKQEGLLRISCSGCMYSRST